MTDYQVTSWRDLPSLVTAKQGDQVAKALLAPRFQAAIDEAAMRLGEVGSDDYLSGWVRGAWQPGDGEPGEVAERVAAELEDTWTESALADYLDTLGPAVAP